PSTVCPDSSTHTVRGGLHPWALVTAGTIALTMRLNTATAIAVSAPRTLRVRTGLPHFLPVQTWQGSNHSAAVVCAASLSGNGHVPAIVMPVRSAAKLNVREV